jgi:hypothetical protein
MEDDDSFIPQYIMGHGTWLLWVGIGLAVVFLGLLVFDLVRHRKRGGHHRRKPESLRARLLNPFKRMRAFQDELKGMLQEHSARKAGHRPKPPEAPRKH